MTVNEMKPTYSKSDCLSSYRWLDHKGCTETEMGAFHPAFKPGKEYFEENLNNKALPQIGYVNNEQAYMKFIKRFAGTHTVCNSLNSRPSLFKNKNNYPRAAYEKEIAIVQNVLLADIDFIEKKYLDEKMASLELLFPLFDEYFLDQGFNYSPVKASTGQGCHLLAAISPIQVNEHPDIAMRTKLIQDNFRKECSKDLDKLGAKVDPLYDNRRVVKTYGTFKPTVKRMSHFYGDTREEDDGLRKLLIEATLPEAHHDNIDQKVNEELPKLFVSLMERDSFIKGLYEGHNKNSTHDTSNSGYDFSLVRKLISLGYCNLDDLYHILSVRPKGAVKQSGKGDQYIRHTLANAIKNQR